MFIFGTLRMFERTSYYGCTAILLVLRRQMPHKFNIRTLGRFWPYRRPTPPKRKSSLIYIFIVNYIYQAFF